jgi:hypothetical protein
LSNEQIPSTPDGLDGLLERQRGTARIAGALAHELNSPLQGLFSLLGVLSRESPRDEQSLIRLEQMRSGLTRLSRIIESFATAYEHVPRSPDRVSVRLFRDQLTDACAERQIALTLETAAPDELRFYCMTPETTRLLGETFSLPSQDRRPLLASLRAEDSHVHLTVSSSQISEPEQAAWQALEGHSASSSLSVLIDEITRFAGGRADFMFDHSSLCGVRLIYAVV